MKITLERIKIINVLLIQNEVLKYLNHKYSTVNCKDYELYCQDIIQIEMLEQIYKLLRAKVESNKDVVNILLSISQSVVLQYCCRTNQISRTKEEKHIMIHISFLIHQKLINI